MAEFLELGQGKRSLLRGRAWLGLASAVVVLAAPAVRADMHESFLTNPLGTRTTLADAQDPTRFTYVTDSYGPGVQASYDTNQPTTKLLFPLGQTLTQNTSFRVSTQFVLGSNLTSIPSNGMQVSFGLVNSTTTGADRAGGSNGGTGGNAYDMVTMDYFPGTDPLYGGPWLSPTVVQSAGVLQSDPSPYRYYHAVDITYFDKLNSALAPDGNLPTSVLLDAVLSYDAPTKVLNLQIYQGATALAINSPDNFTPDSTTISNQLLLTATNYGGASFSSFNVDSFGINLWQDTYNPTGNSLSGDVTFHQLDVTVAVPEPASLGLLGVGALAMLARKRRAH